MCLLTYYPPGVLPDPEALRNGAAFNNDGHGFAIVHDQRLIVRRGMDPEAVISEFVKMRLTRVDGPALFHSRFGTGGRIGRYNCHPFRIGGDRRTVLAHNGILPDRVQPGKRDKRCDTRIAAEELLRGLNLGDRTVRDLIGAWMGPRNKFVLLTTNPRYDRHAYIINEESGLWDGDIWYSNHDYRSVPQMSWKWDGDVYAAENGPACWRCGDDDNVDAHAMQCIACGICLDCGEDYWDACQCYLPIATQRGQAQLALPALDDGWTDDELNLAG